MKPRPAWTEILRESVFDSLMLYQIHIHLIKIVTKTLMMKMKQNHSITW
jgi:hypothetical protein